MKGTSNGVRRWQFLSAALALIGLIDSLYLWSAKVGRPLVCGVGDCDSVNASPYSMLLGIPVAAIGIAGYALLLALVLWAIAARDNAPRWLSDVRLWFASIGLFLAAYLTGIEVFILQAI